MYFKYFLLWFPMVIIGITNGIIRVAGYGRFFDELTAHQISTVTGIILIGTYIWIITKYFKIQSSAQAIGIGLMWLMLTILFEFGFGHFVMGTPWSKLLHDYNILEGRVWSLFLIWVTISPFVINKLSRTK